MYRVSIKTRIIRNEKWESISFNSVTIHKKEISMKWVVQKKVLRDINWPADIIIMIMIGSEKSVRARKWILNITEKWIIKVEDFSGQESRVWQQL